MRQKMIFVLGPVLLVSIVLMSWPSIRQLFGSANDEPTIDIDTPLPPDVVVDTVKVAKARERNSHFKEIDDEINALEKQSWNDNQYRDIKVSTDTKYSMELLNKEEKSLLLDKLDLTNIKTLKAALGNFFNAAKQASELNPIRTAAMVYSKGAYVSNAQDMLKAINDFDNLTRLENKATSASNLTEDEINTCFTSIESLEGQPYLKGSPLVQRISKVSKNSLGELLANMRIEAIRAPINDYITEHPYDEETTKGYASKITELRNHRRINSLPKVKEFCNNTQSDLETHQIKHDRLENWVKTRPDVDCGTLFNKFQYYVRACQQMRGDTLTK